MKCVPDRHPYKISHVRNETIRKAHFCWKHPRYVRWQSKLKNWN